MKTRFLYLLATLALVSVACRGGDDDNTGTPDAARFDARVFDANPEGDNTIYEIQTPPGLPDQTPVTLKGVVVTAIDQYGDNYGGIYVEEPAGGAYSGVLLYRATVPTGMTVAVGDLVDVTGGVTEEFNYNNEFRNPLTEVGPPAGGEMDVVKVGTGTVPEPALVDPVAAAASDDEAEKWEGVLIKFENVAVVEAPVQRTADLTMYEGKVTGPFRVDSSLASIATLTQGMCLQSITGIGVFFYEYKLAPRQESDIVTGGTGCGVSESAADGNCTDTIDNDYDGFADCLDFDCSSDPACQAATTVQAVQQGTIPVDTIATLEGLTVTGLTTDKKYIFVEDPAGGAYSGILVYTGAGSVNVPAEVVRGAQVTVRGRVVEYFDMTELTGDAANPVVFTVTSPTGTMPPASVVTPADLADPATAEQWESVLIEVDSVAVLTEVSPTSHGEWTGGPAATPINVDDLLYASTPAVGDCFAQVVGPLNYSFSAFKVEPRDAADLVTGTGCP